MVMAAARLMVIVGEGVVAGAVEAVGRLVVV
jgi:hypothetical protein